MQDKIIKEFVSKQIFSPEVILRKDISLPKISIITPSFNQVKYLEKTILSVLNQNYANLEYIIIDCGSTDGSQEIIKKYEKYIDFWVSEKDRGQSDAINKGFKRSTGEITAWLNSDDIYLPGTLDNIVRIFNADTKIDVVYGNEYLINSNDDILGERRLIPDPYFFVKFKALSMNIGIYQPASFWKRKLFFDVGALDVNFKQCMDIDLFIRFFFITARFAFIKRALSGFRIHPQSKSLSSRFSDYKSILKEERHKIFEKYGLNVSVPFYKRLLIYLIRSGIYLLQGDGIWLLNKYFTFLLGKDEKSIWLSCLD